MSKGVKVTWRGKEVSDDERAAAVRGLRDSAEFVLEQANRTVPHQEGTLEGSGVASVDGDSAEAAVSYNTPYAVSQHERYLKHANGRRRKWLELTLQECGTRVRDYLADVLRKALGG